LPFIINASSKEQQVKVQGDWFTFKSKQIKEMQEDKVRFLTSANAYLGFVEVDPRIEDLDFKNSKEGQAVIKKAEMDGVRARVAFLEDLKRNEIISLGRDLSRAGLDYDPRIEMSDGMLKHLEELASYKAEKQDEAALKVERIKELEKLIEKK